MVGLISPEYDSIWLRNERNGMYFHSVQKKIISESDILKVLYDIKQKN